MSRHQVCSEARPLVSSLGGTNARRVIWWPRPAMALIKLKGRTRMSEGRYGLIKSTRSGGTPNHLPVGDSRMGRSLNLFDLFLFNSKNIRIL
jgi:hypothetical protein